MIQKTHVTAEHSALRLIRKAIASVQVPDLSSLKGVRQDRLTEREQNLNRCHAKQAEHVRVAEQAATALYQRHYYSDNGQAHETYTPAHHLEEIKK